MQIQTLNGSILNKVAKESLSSPHHTTRHHTIPRYTTPQYTTPHHTTPHHTTPHHTTLHHTTPHHTTPCCTVHHTTPSTRTPVQFHSMMYVICTKNTLIEYHLGDYRDIPRYVQIVNPFFGTAVCVVRLGFQRIQYTSLKSKRTFLLLWRCETTRIYVCIHMPFLLQCVVCLLQMNPNTHHCCSVINVTNNTICATME